MDGAVWASSGMENVQYQQIIDIKRMFDDPNNGFARGFKIGEEQYTVLRVDGDVLHAKGKGSHIAPLTVQKSNQALIFGIGDDQTNAGSLSEAVYRIFNFLVQYGY